MPMHGGFIWSWFCSLHNDPIDVSIQNIGIVSSIITKPIVQNCQLTQLQQQLKKFYGKHWFRNRAKK